MKTNTLFLTAAWLIIAVLAFYVVIFSIIIARNATWQTIGGDIMNISIAFAAICFLLHMITNINMEKRKSARK